MNSKLFNQPIPLLLCGAVLVAAGCLGAATGRVMETGADYGVSAADEENPTTPPEARTRPVRRLRTSLSMPYFSFAQALRPRS